MKRKISITLLISLIIAASIIFIAKNYLSLGKNTCEKIEIKNGDLLIYSNPEVSSKQQAKSQDSEWSEIVSDSGYYNSEVIKLIKSRNENIINIDAKCIHLKYKNNIYYLEANNNSPINNYFYLRGDKILTSWDEILFEEIQ